jgi:hypothetical protein
MKRRTPRIGKGLAIAALFALSSAATGRADVLAGPIVHPTNGSSYYLLDTTTWTQAEAEAVTLGGHLVSIGSADENAWVWETFGPLAGTFWIGLNDAEQEGVFVWSSGAPVAYTNWWVDGGQPDNGGGVENHVEMNNYVWNDNQDSAQFAAVVEVTPAQSIQVRVDWSAAVSGANGSGTLSGSFGVFTVSEPGQSFPLPAGSALVATASGFSEGFANRDYELVNASGGLAIRFDSLEPITTTLVGDGVATHPARWSELSSCDDRLCRVIITRYVASGLDLYSAGRGVVEGSNFNEGYSEGQALYTYTLVPEPATSITGAAALVTLAWFTRGRRAAVQKPRSR